MTSFYSDPENLKNVLRHWLAIFSEGNPPILAWKKDVAALFEMPCYSGFPEQEKQKWLEGLKVKP